jgi:hypothetical protein
MIRLEHPCGSTIGTLGNQIPPVLWPSSPFLESVATFLGGESMSPIGPAKHSILHTLKMGRHWPLIAIFQQLGVALRHSVFADLRHGLFGSVQPLKPQSLQSKSGGRGILQINSYQFSPPPWTSSPTWLNIPSIVRLPDYRSTEELRESSLGGSFSRISCESGRKSMSGSPKVEMSAFGTDPADQSRLSSMFFTTTTTQEAK